MMARVRIGISLIILLGIISFAYYLQLEEHHKVANEDPLQGPHYPIDVGNPNLDSPTAKTKTTFVGALTELFGKDTFNSLFVSNDLVRRIVVTVDGLTAPAQIKSELLPIEPLETAFTVDKGKISQANFSRYEPYIEILQKTDSGKLVATYKKFYFLFQAAYSELGTPNRKSLTKALQKVCDQM